MAVKVIPSQFSNKGEDGDFGWMIQQQEYDDALFIFNDNEEQFRAYMTDPTPGTYGCEDGGGNAAIRSYRCAGRPRAAGVPTGWIKKTNPRTGEPGLGYPELTPAVQGVLDEALAEIKRVLTSVGYQRVYYSAANSKGDLGASIFDPGDDVKAYIVRQLQELGD